MNIINPLNPSPTLEDVKGSFATWRKERVKRERIPDELWKQVHHLTKAYKISTIAIALGLNCQDMQNQLSKRFCSSSLDNPLTFVEVSLKEEKHERLNTKESHSNNNLSFLSIVRPNGLQVMLHLYPQDLSVVLDHLMR